jgi:C4-dicarboxylate-specific signal transduction histidine kinase
VDSALADLRRLLGRIAGPDVDLVVEVEACLPPVRFRVGAFRLVVIELVRAASETIVDRGRIAVHASAKPGSVLLTVADSGPARACVELPGAFEPFHATKSRGASAEAGLAAVRDVVATNGGDIEVVATPGGGSRFSIYLPVWD